VHTICRERLLSKRYHARGVAVHLLCKPLWVGLTVRGHKEAQSGEAGLVLVSP
jgi:hypothetical protein